MTIEKAGLASFCVAYVSCWGGGGNDGRRFADEEDSSDFSLDLIQVQIKLLLACC